MLPVVYHPSYDATSVPDGHRFPMRKYARLSELLRASHIADQIEWLRPQPAQRSQLIRAHYEAYVDAVLTQTLDTKLARRIGFDVTADVSRRAALSAGGTTLAAWTALDTGVAVNAAGGSHHAGPDGGAGFCVFNDVAVAAMDVLAAGGARRILIVDCDVHHGDGTARIFAAEPRVFTLSVHCDDNWPRDKPPSDLDAGLPRGAGDDAYLAALSAALSQAIDRARPELVFYNAGVDPHASDRLGLLQMSDAGLRARDSHVVETCSRLGLPLAAVLGGGYSADPADVAARHFILFEALTGA